MRTGPLTAPLPTFETTAPLGFTTGFRSLARVPSARGKETIVTLPRSVPSRRIFDLVTPVEGPMQRVTHWIESTWGSPGAVVPPPAGADLGGCRARGDHRRGGCERKKQRDPPASGATGERVGGSLDHSFSGLRG